MNDPRRIVVGIDGSAGSRVVLRWALREAELQNAVLEVLHASREPLIVVPDEYPPELVEAGQMDEAASRLIDRELGSVGANPSVTVERKPVGGGNRPVARRGVADGRPGRHRPAWDRRGRTRAGRPEGRPGGPPRRVPGRGRAGRVGR